MQDIWGSINRFYNDCEELKENINSSKNMINNITLIYFNKFLEQFSDYRVNENSFDDLKIWIKYKKGIKINTIFLTKFLLMGKNPLDAMREDPDFNIETSWIEFVTLSEVTLNNSSPKRIRLSEKIEDVTTLFDGILKGFEKDEDIIEIRKMKNDLIDQADSIGLELFVYIESNYPTTQIRQILDSD